MNKKIKFIALNAMIAALYAVLTIVIAPFSYGPFQFRASEVMVLLGWINPGYIPGLILGCFLANISSPFGLVDMIFGTLATALALFAMKKTKNLYIASLWPTVSMIIIAAEIVIMTNTVYSFFVVLSQLVVSEFVIVSVFGVAIVKTLERTQLYNMLSNQVVYK